MDINVSKTEKIENWNRDLAHVLIPNNVILAIYILLGICGNGIVIYIYNVKFSGKNVDRYFIPYLAVTDLLASLVCGSFGIALNMMQATFYNNTLCKTWWFFAALTTFMSTLSLLAIAVQRYLKVVRPFGRQMDIKLNRIALSMIIFISILCAIPTPILYGSVPFPHAQEDIVGQRCTRIKGGNKAFSIFYGCLIGLMAIASVGALFGIYLRIGWTILKHLKFDMKFTENDEDGPTAEVTSFDDSKGIGDHGYKTDHTIDHGTKAKKNVEKRGGKYAIEETNNKVKQRSPSQDQHVKINRKIMHKFTLMFMLITTIYLICYIPKVFIMLFEALKPNFWESFSDRDRAAMLFVYRMFIINNIANPFVYAFLDLKFRNELQSIFCRRK